MLNEEETIEKLHRLVLRFDEALKRKEGRKAVSAYQQALSIALFMELPVNVRLELFGDSTEDKDGLFRRDRVIRAQELAIRQEGELARQNKYPAEQFNVKYLYI